MQIFFANWANTASDWFSSYTTQYAPITKDLPANVHLLNLRTLETGETLVRLNHIFAVNEDATLSKPATVDLGSLFKDLTISSIREMSLTANTPVNDVHRLTWNTGSLQSKPFVPSSATKATAPYVITLQPMEIRTFLVRFMTQ